MKTAICGKGGCGKSTTTALLAKELARMGKRVLVIDSDESNYGLHRQPGMELPKDFTAFFGGKEDVLKDMMLSNFACKFFDGPWTLADIPAGYYSEKDGVKLMASGKIHQANEGCARPMNSVIQRKPGGDKSAARGVCWKHTPQTEAGGWRRAYPPPFLPPPPQSHGRRSRSAGNCKQKPFSIR